MVTGIRSELYALATVRTPEHLSIIEHDAGKGQDEERQGEFLGRASFWAGSQMMLRSAAITTAANRDTSQT